MFSPVHPGCWQCGKKAPYESTPYRLPVPFKSLTEEMATYYRELVGEYENPEDPALIAAVKKVIAPGAAGNGNENALQDVYHQLTILTQAYWVKFCRTLFVHSQVL